MAATATQQVLHNGARNLILKYTISGLGGDETAGPLVDLSTLDPNAAQFRLDRVTWSLTGFSCALEWGDGAAAVDLFEMTTTPGTVDLRKYGGIADNAALATGDVLFTTTGYSTNDSGEFTLWFRKRSANNPLQFSRKPAIGSVSLAGTAPMPLISPALPTVGSLAFGSDIVTLSP